MFLEVLVLTPRSEPAQNSPLNAWGYGKEHRETGGDQHPRDGRRKLGEGRHEEGREEEKTHC